MLLESKLCELSDFHDEELLKYIREIFSFEFNEAYDDNEYIGDSKRWEIAMAIRAMENHGKLIRDSDILGVGAGLEVTSYYLTKKVGRVIATDIYMNAGVWSYGAPLGFLLDPKRYSKFPYEEDRLLPMHMDARRLRFPDESFDGIYSSGSIEHLGNLNYVAECSSEMGRVLKKGGLLTLATEYKLAGPSDGIGWDPFVILFSPALLQKYIIEASGLKPTGEIDYSMSEDTLEISQPLLGFLEKADRQTTAFKKSEVYPNLALSHEGYAFGSVHLALYKPHDYVSGSADWAKPAESTLRIIDADNTSSIELLSASKTPQAGATSAEDGEAQRLAEKKSLPIFLSATDELLFTHGGAKTPEGVVIQDADEGALLLYGPYVELPIGYYQVDILMSGQSVNTGQLHVILTGQAGQKELANTFIDLPSLKGNKTATFKAKLSSVSADCELKVLCSAGTSVTLEAIKIKKLTPLQKTLASIFG
ncbi:class I SAM-dependent methyltransferase [Desulfosediminicola sp.]|uniref:class I SAM-dependent methyltransferase n=1 Tax=Desulfosediminicola sp. TaxID=2886825 RepID=UPI003AF29908